MTQGLVTQGMSLTRLRDLAELLDDRERNRDPTLWKHYDAAARDLELAVFNPSWPSADSSRLEALMSQSRPDALVAFTQLGPRELKKDLLLGGFLLSDLVEKVGPNGVPKSLIASLPDHIIELACEVVQDVNTGAVPRPYWFKVLASLCTHPRWIEIVLSNVALERLLPVLLCEPINRAELQFLSLWLHRDAATLQDFVLRHQGHLCVLFFLRAAATIAQKDEAAGLLHFVLCKLDHAVALVTVLELVRHGVAQTLTRTPDTENVLELMHDVMLFSSEALDQLLSSSLALRLLTALEGPFCLSALKALRLLAYLKLDALLTHPDTVDKLLGVGPLASPVLRLLCVDAKVAARVVRSRVAITVV